MISVIFLITQDGFEDGTEAEYRSGKEERLCRVPEYALVDFSLWWSEEAEQSDGE